MDANVNTSTTPANPPPGDPPPAAPPVAAGGEGEPSSHAAEVSQLKMWFKDNFVSMLITAVAIALVCIYLDPIDTLKVVIGLGLVIFIHELGHFVAAKWCDVHVKTFSIGFGPAIPFCSYKWGETTYMLGIIPLGGYVAMVGEGDHGADEEAEEDPRSFKHKTVGQRMLIISAGVVMNVILGMGCFVAAYLHGVREEPAIIGMVMSGGSAWRAGLLTDDRIVKIGSRDNPTFKDLRPIVMSTRKGERIPVVVVRNGKTLDPIMVEPLREEGTYFPTLGIAAQTRPTLLAMKKKDFRPTVPGTPAALAKEFEPGDRIVGMTDPDSPTRALTPLKPDPDNPDHGPNIDDYYRRLSKLAGQPVTFQVLRKQGSPGNPPLLVTVQPAYRASLGMLMQMGEIVALRQGGPAAEAGVIARSEEHPLGDRIKTVKLPERDGKQTWLTTGEEKDVPNVTIRKLDPVLLPLEIKKWYDRNPPDLKVTITVLRTVGHLADQPVELKPMVYDPTYRYDREILPLPNSPVPIAGLGLGYWVNHVVLEVAKDGPAEKAGVRPGDRIKSVQFKSLDDAGNIKDNGWEDITDHQWASAEASFQSRPPFQIDVKVERGGNEMVQLSIAGQEDRNWPVEDRGLVFQQDYRTQKAVDVADALNLGAHRTARFIKEVYMNLSAMIFGRVSPRTMSGPLTIGTVAYRFAGEDFWQFLLFLGMISVNLAVVNFLPIPVLDGGYVVFLLLEKVLGRPVPERIFAFAMYAGLFLILSLMVFVLVLDVRRLFFGLF